MLNQRQRLGTEGRCFQHSLTQLLARLRALLEVKTACLRWQMDHLPDLNRCRRRKLKSSAQHCEIVRIARSQKRLIKIASQRRNDKNSLASNQGGQRGQIALL